LGSLQFNKDPSTTLKSIIILRGTIYKKASHGSKMVYTIPKRIIKPLFGKIYILMQSIINEHIVTQKKLIMPSTSIYTTSTTMKNAIHIKYIIITKPFVS